MKKIRPFRLSDETVAKLDVLCAGNRTEWIERVIEAGGNLTGVVLAEKPKARLKELCEKMAMGQAAVLEMAVMEFQQKTTITLPPTLPGPTPPREGGKEWDTNVPPAPTTLEGKKAAALAALASMPNRQSMSALAERADVPLLDTPRAPFDLNLEGEPHRVTALGKKLGLFYIGGGEPVFNRYLQPGELESFWAKRIIK